MSGLVTGYELISTFYTPLSRLVTGGHGMSQHVTGKAVTKGVLHISEHNCILSFKLKILILNRFIILTSDDFPNLVEGEVFWQGFTS